MIIGLKEQDIQLKEVMTEQDMELYLLKNGYDLGEGVCEPGKEHLYSVDSTKVVDYAISLGYDVQLNIYQTNDFVKVA